MDLRDVRSRDTGGRGPEPIHDAECLTQVGPVLARDGVPQSRARGRPVDLRSRRAGPSQCDAEGGDRTARAPRDLSGPRARRGPGDPLRADREHHDARSARSRGARTRFLEERAPRAEPALPTRRGDGPRLRDLRARGDWRRGTGIEPAWNAATRSTLDLKSRPGTSLGNLAAGGRSFSAAPDTSVQAGSATGRRRRRGASRTVPS